MRVQCLVATVAEHSRVPVAAAMALAVAGALLVGCAPAGAGAVTAAQPVSTPAAATPSTSQPPTTSPTGTARPSTSARAAGLLPNRPARPVVDAVFLAAGVRQYLSCAGNGPSTVVVVPGLGASHQDWSAVLPALRQVTRTCIYDRPGLGLSPPGPNPSEVVDAGLQAAQLFALLQAADEPGPFVLLGHSYGGLVARAFVHQHGSLVRGVLLAESVTPGDYSDGSAWIEGGHRVDLVASAAATGGGPPLGATPLLVLSASQPDRNHLGGIPYGQPAWQTTLWIHEQANDATLSSDSVQVIAHSGHVLQQDNPGAVDAAVQVLVAAVDLGRHLTCSWTWRTVSASCT